MTEERRKEHAEEYWQKHIIPNVDKWSGLLQLVSTVAAKAREEGIEDFADALAEKFGPYSVILELAERVKEKGK